MNKISSTLLILLMICVVCIAPQPSQAVDSDIGAGANFQSSVTLSAISDMDFGTITYSSLASNTIQLKTNNDNIDCSNTSDYQCPASGSRGSFTLSGTIGDVVDISCDADGNLSNGIDTIGYDRVRGKISGINKRCKGLGSVSLSHTLSSNSANNVLVTGMIINITATGVPSGGVYNTSNAGGDAITYRAIYQ